MTEPILRGRTPHAASAALTPRWNGRAALLATAATLGLYLLLPLLERPPDGRSDAPLRPPVRIRLVAPPATPPALPAQVREPAPPPPLPRPPARTPLLEEPKRRLPPPPARLDLRLNLGLPAGRHAPSVVTATPPLPLPTPPPLQSTAPQAARGAPETAPRGLYQPEPRYPAAARRQGIEGHVVLEFEVQVNGRTRALRVLSAQPPGFFESAATHAVAQWRFRPGTRDGHPVPVRVRQRVVFTLQDQDAEPAAGPRAPLEAPQPEAQP